MKTKEPGFSLTELMIVIVIMAILAAVAVPIYSRYIRKSRTSEAVSNLGTIAMFQETYFSEADTYITCQPNPPTVPNPSTATGRTAFSATPTGWSQLGRVIPTGTMLYFQYEVRAGQFDSAGNSQSGTYLVAADAVAKPGGAHCGTSTTNLTADLLGIPHNPSSNWYYVTAVGDQRQSSPAKCSLFIKVIDRPDISITNDIE